ncbi:MAG: putative methylthioribose-1-phosphate isomerase [Candidatus Bathyarchaeota archaeon BA2]|nr:MAG: putative methylthioribose-1-phosphate isomerase [Candidatus Bathyarchaeota archaeon BA2]
MRTIEWQDGLVVTIDQTKLPSELVYLKMKKCHEVASAINDMKLRGAPLIGVAAAYGLALTAYYSKAERKEDLINEIEQSAEILRRTRPTAMNPFWAINRIARKAREASGDAKDVAKVIVDEAQRMADEDVETNRKIGEHGSKLIDDGDTVLTHCNTGSLATVDYGTALGVIRAAWEQGKTVSVIATETRPKLQGARLTAYELKRDGIPVTLITDSMVGSVMSRQMVDKVFVGADRIVRDAVINKIGTYTIAVLAHEHGIPFYVAAPTSTMDLSHTSNEAVIEERNPEEVTHFFSRRIAPEGVKAMNPAFDVTPMKYVSAIVTEKGVLSPEDLKQLHEV